MGFPALAVTESDPDSPTAEVSEVDAAWMHPQRTSTGLRQFDDLGQSPPPRRWSWAIARLESTGRIVLPPEARRALGSPPGHSVDMRVRYSRLALVLRPDGPGATLSVDGRCRLYLPVSSRRGDSVLIGTRTEVPLAMVAPVEVLDSIGGVLAGDRT